MCSHDTIVLYTLMYICLQLCAATVIPWSLTAKSYILICTCLHPFFKILMRQKVLYIFEVCWCKISQRKIENWLLQTQIRGVSRTGAGQNSKLEFEPLKVVSFT